MPCSVVLEGTINGKSKKAKIVDIQLADLLTTLDTEQIPTNSWGRKTCLLFMEESLSVLKWHIANTEDKIIVCTPTQPRDTLQNKYNLRSHTGSVQMVT